VLIAGGVRAVHVPLKGDPETILEIATGVSSAAPLIKKGRLIALAVSWRKRPAALPDAPTTQEASLADADYTYWNGMLAPSKTPRDSIDRLAQIGQCDVTCGRPHRPIDFRAQNAQP